MESCAEDRTVGQSEPARSQAAQLTLQALRQRIRDYDTPRARDRLSNAVVRGAFAGLALRGSLHLVSLLAGMATRRRRQRRQGASPGTAATAAAVAAARQVSPSTLQRVIETLRYGAFFGAFSGVYVAADELIAMLVGRKKSRAWRSLVAGLLAGPTIRLTGPHSDHTTLSNYVFLRGLVLLTRCGNLPSAPEWRKKVLAPTRWSHGDVLLMCLAVSQLGYSWLVTPKTLPGAYVRFLNKHGGRPEYIYTALRELISLEDRGLGTQPHRLQGLRGTAFEDYGGRVPCEFLHAGQTCDEALVHFAPRAYLRALPVYLPVYLTPAVLIHRQKLLDPVTGPVLWRKLALGILRSSAFLAAFCALGWRSMCLLHQRLGHTSGVILATAFGCGGLALFLEKKSRRMDLAIYCMSRAMETAALNVILSKSPAARFLPRRMDAILFSVASACILHCYSDHWGERRDVIPQSYLSVFDFILGNSGFKNAAIRHEPSTYEVLSLIGSSQPVRIVRTMSNHALWRLGPGPRLSGSLGSPSGPDNQLSPSACLAEEQRRAVPEDGRQAKGAAEYEPGDAPAPIAEGQESE